ncbi:MAG: hypothetical protein Q8L63_00950 [Alphaproteobacteria bacterium]|nr:hypothetical protein [Alphaproteobacteria bacterium]
MLGARLFSCRDSAFGHNIGQCIHDDLCETKQWVRCHRRIVVSGFVDRICGVVEMISVDTRVQTDLIAHSNIELWRHIYYDAVISTTGRVVVQMCHETSINPVSE